MEINIKQDKYFKSNEINGLHIFASINGIACSRMGCKVHGSKINALKKLHDQKVDALNATTDVFSDQPNSYEIEITYWCFDPLLEGERNEIIRGTTTLDPLTFDQAMHQLHQEIKALRPWVPKKRRSK